MSIAELFRISIVSLGANKMRSILTMLGIVIGVCSVVAMLSVGEGAKQMITRSIEGLGTNLLFVMPGQLKVGMGGQGMGSSQTLKNEDAAALAEECPSILLVAPENSKSARVKAGNQNTMTQITGTNQNYPEVRNMKLSKGVFFTAGDNKNYKKVAIIGSTVVDNLFPNQEPVGKEITINRNAFTVIGVLEKKGQSGPVNPDDMILIPILTFQKSLFAMKYLRSINICVANKGDMDLAIEEITSVLRKRHRTSGANDDFNVRNQTDMLNRMSDITDTITIFLGGIAFISLFVGGIGIMNIMLVSVTERTREIGLRKALGATKTDILSQFLIESIFLCVLGGVIGILGGAGISYAISHIGNWNTNVSAWAVALSFTFSLAVGLFFGIYPANKAASLDCVVALRYE